MAGRVILQDGTLWPVDLEGEEAAHAQCHHHKNYTSSAFIDAYNQLVYGIPTTKDAIAKLRMLRRAAIEARIGRVGEDRSSTSEQGRAPIIDMDHVPSGYLENHFISILASARHCTADPDYPIMGPHCRYCGRSWTDQFGVKHDASCCVLVAEAVMCRSADPNYR